MDIEVRPCASAEELRDAMNGIGHYFGFENQLEDAERFGQWIETDRMIAAFEGDRIVGGAGGFTYRMSVPGGDSVPAGGTTVVGVLPSHRRRGVLTKMIRAHLEDCRTRGEVAAYLWASEATIYGRFGYGLASRMGRMTLARDRAAFAVPFEPRGTVRIVDETEAFATFPSLYDEVRKQRPGLNSRTDAWWQTRRLFDDPARRFGAGPKNRALLELDGNQAGYAIYNVKQDWLGGSSKGTVTITEVVTPTPEATRELWRWLLDFDWTSEFAADLLPLDHPLFLLLAEPRRMLFQLNDGVWVRLLDVEAALSARTYASDDSIVIDVRDTFLPDVAGRYRVTSTGTTRTDDDGDIELDITALGSVYLGGFTFADLVRGSRATERVSGSIERADAMFRTSVEPWCAEIF
ncbi:MAG TPA: GNAT family N-acetyltransferase [Gaiellaceae bacterium]|nr:GNAT family N-acetyltransferase [Gaiellaceae bacterium]